MALTEIARQRFFCLGFWCASDLTDAEWALIEPFMPLLSQNWWLARCPPRPARWDGLLSTLPEPEPARQPFRPLVDIGRGFLLGGPFPVVPLAAALAEIGEPLAVNLLDAIDLAAAEAAVRVEIAVLDAVSAEARLHLADLHLDLP